jgi:hypothetical protein
MLHYFKFVKDKMLIIVYSSNNYRLPLEAAVLIDKGKFCLTSQKNVAELCHFGNFLVT